MRTLIPVKELKKISLTTILVVSSVCFSFSFKNNSAYKNLYLNRIEDFNSELSALASGISNSDLSEKDFENIKQQIETTRLKLKGIDFWLCYLEPTIYKKINGPLPVEWETEVFEKFEKPYKRNGAGLTLAELYLEEMVKNKDSLLHLIQSSLMHQKHIWPTQ